MAGTETIPGAGLEILLTREVELEVISLASEVESDLIDAIDLYQPSVVVMYENGLVKEATIIKMLTENLNQPLILVNTESNYMQIYCKHEFLLTRASDLAEVIHSF